MRTGLTKKPIIIQTQDGILDSSTKPMMRMATFYSNFLPVDTV